VKYFYIIRNTIPYIQDIEIINVFYDGVRDIKTVEEITMKKPKMVVDFLAVADVCIEASKARARLLESRGKGPSKKKQDDREVTQLIMEITGIIGIAEIVGIISSNPQTRRRRDRSMALLT
jgi:hypothetical protein